MKNKVILILTLIFTLAINALSQTKEELALQKGREAIALMDKGEFLKSIELLEEAKDLDPESLVYPYEIAYAKYSLKDYEGASKILQKLLRHKDLEDNVFQLLGNAYDFMGKREKAIKTYEEGLKKFPNSGKLYLELGIVEGDRNDWNKALSYHEKGIAVDPAYPSNYFWASKIYCNSTEEYKGIIYGEIFMNIERNSRRTVEISKLLYDTYKSQITFSGDSVKVSFSQSGVITLEDLKNPETFKLPFGVGVFEPIMALSIITEKGIDIESLNRIRTRFVDNYFEKGFATQYPNFLFDFQNQLKQEGHLEAYNHWILMMGDESGFDNWKEKNKEKWDAFTDWFSLNPLPKGKITAIRF